MKSQTMPTAIQEDKESITKYLNECGDDMFMYKFGIYKMAISNSLINYMGYDVDEFATEVVKYRTVLVEYPIAYPASSAPTATTRLSHTPSKPSRT